MDATVSLKTWTDCEHNTVDICGSVRLMELWLLPYEQTSNLPKVQDNFTV